MRTTRRAFAGHWLVVVACIPMPAATLAAQNVTGPTTVRSDIHRDVSLPLRDLIRNAPPPTIGLAPHEAQPVRRIPLPPGLVVLQEDPLRQNAIAPLSPLTPLTSNSFEGLGQGQYGFSVTGAPPDTNGAVGATQYVQWVNTSFAIFNKGNGALIAGPTLGNTLWTGFGGACQTNNDGDPIVLYDRIANRWVMSQFSVSTTPYLQCIAVSTTSDATGTWNRYSFQYSNFDDYPKMGVWPDAYYETFNMFNGNTFVGAEACAYNRTAMLNGQSATQVCFQQSSAVGGLLPADFDGTTPPPTGSPNFMLYYGTNSLNLFKFHVDFVNTANSTFTGPTVINVAAFNPLCSGGTCVPQPSTTNQLDSLADRLMYRLAYRNLGSHESLVVNHSVTVSSSGGVRWYEIQNPGGTPTVAQQGTFAPDSAYRWMGSIAMDQAGDIAVGYSKSSSSVFPSIAFAGRIPTDPSGTLETESPVVSGTGSQTGTLTRWGDYSGMTVDPVDDCTFWYTQEYMTASGTFNWNTRIANFKFPSCGTSGSVTLSPTSLTFGSQIIGNPSASQAVTLTNSQSVSLSVSSIVTSGDYAQTNNCGASVAANANCTINVTFTPTSAGTRTGTLTVTDNGPGRPQTAGLAGTGVQQSVTLTPGSLPFGNQNVGATSAAQLVTLSNNQAVSLAIAGVVTSGDYAQTNNCGASLAANANCTINVTFTPSAAGTRTSTLTVTDNGPGSPQTASLTGVGVANTCVSGVLSNGGFETDDLSCWTSGGVYAPFVTSTQRNSGSYSAQLGGSTTPEPNGDSSIYQTVSIPSTVTKTTLTFFYWPATTDTVTYDWQEAQVRNATGTLLAQIFKVASNTKTWTPVTYDLTTYKGQTVQIYFNVHGDGYGDLTYMYLDDIRVSASTDNTPPTTQVTAPADNAVVSGTVSLTATASDVDDPIVAQMQIFIDGSMVSSNTNSNTIMYSWNTTTATNGTHTVYSKAYDVAGNVGTSSTVTVTVNNTNTQLIQNGGFDTGNLTNWSAGGAALPTIVTGHAHSGTYSSQLGASSGSEPNGNSSIYQTITIPSTATKATLTFWYWPSTTDTITYDWQEAQVQNSSGTTLAQIMKVCSNAHAWTQVTYDLTSYKGQTIRVYFNIHQDGYGDLTYIYLDDVAVSVQ